VKRLVGALAAVIALVAATTGCEFGGAGNGGDAVCFVLRGTYSPYGPGWSKCDMSNRNSSPTGSERQACYDVMAISQYPHHKDWCWSMTGGSVYPTY
jgi:hypothetical protein